MNEAPAHRLLPVVQVESPDVILPATTYLESDCDDQLLIYIKFQSDVRLTNIVIAAPPEDGTRQSLTASCVSLILFPSDRCPNQAKLFVNQHNMDFSNAESTRSVQEVELKQTPLKTSKETPGSVLIKTNIVKFAVTSSVTLFIPGNISGAATTVISRLKFIGQPLRLKI